ncbi:MAG: hypothetical protein U9P79_08850 [Candidatus Cloacimonadota bacterium]|nr:hypothetical protein [Candidatus Cloacimonadota bacterium]
MAQEKKLFYRIFKEDAAEQGLDMEKFRLNRRKGLYPFQSSENKVVWLHRKEFRIAAIVKRDVSIKKRDRRHEKKGRKKSDDVLDFSGLLSQKGYKTATYILGSIIIIYIALKIFLAL